MDELKPCPFCGGEVEMLEETGLDDDDIFYMIQCKNCPASSCFGDSDRNETVGAWNRRTENEKRIHMGN